MQSFLGFLFAFLFSTGLMAEVLNCRTNRFKAPVELKVSSVEGLFITNEIQQLEVFSQGALLETLEVQRDVSTFYQCPCYDIQVISMAPDSIFRGLKLFMQSNDENSFSVEAIDPNTGKIEVYCSIRF